MITSSPPPAHDSRFTTGGRLHTSRRRVVRGLAALGAVFLPVRCAGCAAEGVSLCLRCSSAFDGPYGVHRPATATGPPVYALAAYQDEARTVLLAYKERGRRDLARPLGRLVATVLPLLGGARAGPDGTWWLVPAPSRRLAASARGGSHTVRLARAAAEVLAERGVPAAVAPALRLAAGARDSVGLDALARVANLAGRVRQNAAGSPPPNTPVVLLDDVVTTGATAAACTAALTDAGLRTTAVLAMAAA